MKKSEKSTPKTKKKSKKPKKAEPEKKEEKEIIDPLFQTFILENIRTLDYRDIAKFIKVKPEKLKSILGGLGINVPVAGARKWDKIEAGKYRSISDCSQCQVQLNHSMFLVGTKNCHKCIEKNINLWINEGEKIRIIIPE